jgi:hypothetical protein
MGVISGATGARVVCGKYCAPLKNLHYEILISQGER